MAKNIIISIFITCLFIACGPKPQSKEILFVCKHGAARSPIAAAYFNKLAEENDLNFHAVFRGTTPDTLLSKATINGLTNDNFNIEDWQPQRVSALDIKRAHTIVSFDCNVASKTSTATKLAWNGTPSISKDYSVARNAIKEKASLLIENLK